MHLIFFHQYSHFLLFVNWMLNGRLSKDDTICPEDKKIYKKLLNKNRDIIKEFNELINENLWIKYFINLKLYKEKWVDLLIAEALTTVIIGLCTIAFVIPGIIMMVQV